MAAKEAQINLRLPADLDAWIEARAGGKGQKPGFVRQILERERAREEQEQMRKMFNAAWDSLSPEEKTELREQREDWMDVFSGGGQKGIRPCLTVSTDGLNRSRFGTVIVCPITTTAREHFVWRAKMAEVNHERVGRIIWGH